MAIVFAKPKRKDFYQIILGVAFIILVIIFLFLLFKRGPEIILPKLTGEIHPPQINFEHLDNPLLKKLEPYPGVEEFTGILGREIPFISTSPALPTTPSF
ncbi:MAG: hypothetical protein LR000_00725 [Candidatus Pacebacteria bacterium]|nr:hypothetical protein [Candidatus Paceibacterota bacterium]